MNLMNFAGFVVKNGHVVLLLTLLFTAMSAQGQTNTVAGQYTVSGNELISIYNCTDPLDNDQVNVQSRSLSITEGIAGNFTGTLSMAGVTKDGTAVSGSFAITGTSNIGNPRNLTGTMISNDPGISILNGNFSAQWTRVGTRSILSFSISGSATSDGTGSCNYAAYLPSLNLDASTTSDTLTGTYTAGSIPLNLSNCTDPGDNEVLYIRSGTISLTENTPGNFAGTLALTAITKAGIRSGTFNVTGTAPAGNPRTLTGTMTSQTPGLQILNGAFSATWSQTGEVTRLNVALSGTGSDGDGSCNYSVSIPLTGTAPATNCPFSLSVLLNEFPFFGGSNQITLDAAAGCAWSVTTSAPWITVSPSSGTGNAVITVSTAPNPSTVPRYGVIAVGGRTFEIVQAGTIPADTRQLAFVSLRDGNPEIYKMNADGSGQIRMTNATGSDLEPQWSPNGSKIAFRSQRDGNSELYVMNADGSAQTRLTTNSLIDSQPTWSPDGAKIAFRCQRGSPTRDEICIINANGTGETQITTGTSFKAQPKWSPDGTKILFITDAAELNNVDVYTMNVNGTNVVRLTTTAGIDSQPDWSPNGSKIVFTSFRNSNFELYSMDANGANQTRLTSFTLGDDAQPSYSPDGSKIAFTRGIDANANFEVFTVNANGSGDVRLTFAGGDDAQADWRTAISTPPVARTPFDLDGDGKTDLAIFRPGPGEWWYSRSSDGGNRAFQFGSGSDNIVPADYTGDGKTDVAFFRPSTGQWFVLRSEDSSFFAFPFGNSTDVPVPADYDGDGKADAAVFRESSLTWFINKSSGGTDIIGFGAAGDKPVPADYDGDGKADIAIYRPNAVGGAQWWIQRSSTGVVFATQFGASTDKTVQGDFTGDGKADIAFWRPSTGFWNVLRSEDFSFYAFPFGTNGDIPVPGDYDGDGKIDAGVFRQPGAQWFVNKSTGGTLIQAFGIAGDLPLPTAYVR